MNNMQTKSKQSKHTKQVVQEEQQVNQAMSNQTEKPTSEKPDNETVKPQASETDSESFALPTAPEATDEEQKDLVEVDELLADFLATGDFMTGNSNHSARQLNAALAIVNHMNGKRAKFRKDLSQYLAVQVGDFVKVTVKNKQVILLKALNGEGIQLKKGGYLYSSELVEAITKEFAFDFTNQSTHHLLNVAYKKWNNQVVAIITL